MKRTIGTLMCSALLAFAVGCSKKKDGDKAADPKAGDPKAGETMPAGDKTGETTPPAGGEVTPPAGGEASADTLAACKKIEELATKEGGEALKNYNEGLKGDCAKEMAEGKTKAGDAKFKEFVDCLNSSETMTAAMDKCKQID